MAGDFNEVVRPTLPGAYTRYIAQRPAVPPPAAGSVIALPVVLPWGPMDVATLVTDYADFQAQFGIAGIVDDTQPGVRAVRDVFRGEGLSGLGGAGGAIITRFGGTAAAQATITLDNPAAADVLKVDARYEGVGGNGLRIVTSPIVSNTQTVEVYQGTRLLEQYTYSTNVAPALANLRTTINSLSKVLRIANDVTGLILESTTGLLPGNFSLVGGNDGATLVAGDWSAVWDTFANDDFAYIAPFNIPWSDTVAEPHTTNRTIIAGLVQWVKDENARGHRVSAMVGMILDATVSQSIALATACASEFIVALGGPGVNDDLWGPLSTAQLVPRVAGIYANRGETQAAHFARLAGTLPRPKLAGGAISLVDAEQMTNAGVVAIMRDRYREAPTRLVKSVNTYTGNTTDKPKSIYSNPKYVLTMQQLANDIEADAERWLIGRVTVNANTRNAAAARALRLVARREPNAISPGSSVIALPGSDLDEFVNLQVDLMFGRALAQLFVTANVR